MAKTNGRSTTTDGGRLTMPIPTAVAAAASVPSSFTSTNALCRTSVMHSWPLGFIRAKSPCPESQNADGIPDRKSTRLNSSHDQISYAVFCLKKKKIVHLSGRFISNTLEKESVETYELYVTETSYNLATLIPSHKRQDVKHAYVHANATIQRV